MDRKQARDEMFNIQVALKTKPMSEEERNCLKEKLEYYRKELAKALQEEAKKQMEEQKKEGIINEVRK